MDSLRRHPGLAHFTPDQLDLLESCTSTVTVEKGTTVIRDGEQGSQLYFIQAGAVEVRRDTTYGEFVLTRLASGDLFGELALVDSEPRAGNVVAISDLDLRVLDPKALGLLVAENPLFEVALYWALWKSLAKKLRTNNLKLVRFFQRQVERPAIAAVEPAEAIHLSLAERQRVFQEIGLSNMEVNYLASLAEALRLRSNQTLLQDGSPGNHMYLVVDGRIMVSKYIPGAGEEALTFLERGDIFGEMSVIDDLPRSAQAKADAGGAVVLSVRKEILHKILDPKKVSSIRILKILCRQLAGRLREGNEKLVGWFILSGGSHAEGLQEF